MTAGNDPEPKAGVYEDDPWYWATGVLVGERGLSFDPDELLRRHEVDQLRVYRVTPPAESA